MKRISIFLLALLQILCICACAKADTLPNGDAEGNESDKESWTMEEQGTVSQFPKERRLTIKSGMKTLILECFTHTTSRSEPEYSSPVPRDSYSKSYRDPKQVAFLSCSSSYTANLPTLHHNGEILIETSEDCNRFHIYVASYNDNEYAVDLETGWKEITLEDLNALDSGTWYLQIETSWKGDYYPEYQEYEYLNCRYGFVLLVDQDYGRDLFLESQIDIFKLGTIHDCIVRGLWMQETYVEISSGYLDNYLKRCKWEPSNLIRIETLMKKMDGIKVVDAESYDTAGDDSGFDPMAVLYRYSLPTVYSDGKLPEFCAREYDLTVLHENEDTVLTEEQQKVFETNHEILTEHEGEDLRFCQADGIVDYYRDGIRYTYANGELSEIYWESGDTKFWIDFLPAYFSLTEADWENISSPILKCFLNKDQTATAIAWFDELITADEAQ